MLQKIDLFGGLIGADIGIGPQGPDLLGLQALPLWVGPDNIWMNSQAGLPAARAVPAGRGLPGTDPGGGQGLGQGTAVFPHHQIGVG